MVASIAVKLICIANQLEMPFLARPLRPIARRAALRRSKYSGIDGGKFLSASIEEQARVLRSLCGFKSYTTSLLENQAKRLIAAINRCGLKAVNETETLKMEREK